MFGRRAKGRSKADRRDADVNPVGLDDLLAAGMEVMDTEGEPAAVAAVRVFESMTPSSEALETLALIGLASRLTDLRNRLNRMTPETDEDQERERRAFLGRFQLGTRHTPQRLSDVLARVVLDGADGRQKSLLDFGMEDVRAFRGRAESQATGWQRRVVVMAEYEAQLTKHKAASGRELPEAALKRIRKLAQEAW
jgi:hypothetical protein